MKFLIPGLVLFFSVHLVPSSPRLREIFVGRFQMVGYKILFNLLSIVSIVLIVYGLMEAPFEPLYEPPSWGRHLVMLLMLPAIYLFLSNSVGPAPSSAKAVTAHPVNWAVILWSTGHLFSNGDLAHVLLFCTLWLFSVISIVTGNSRGLRPKLEQRPPVAAEAVFVVIVMMVYGALVWGHPYFTGMPIVVI